ncbi:sugar transferase [Adlercreutzia sp. R25]|uniref:sugar transferase n=1 Tax=Adlercreutzia shanghongiae TaxID=3111773 RepID=UPI002DB7C413|nr:sugar transferase [Adlercreutzia sp. R25]MEC4273886.1 sugar transferase [Adlercreutzia sp. R25]
MTAGYMYKRHTDRFFKHFDFIIIDLICLQIAFVLAYAASGYGFNPYEIPLYSSMAVFIEVLDLVTLLLMDTMSGVLRRGVYKELVATFRHGAIIGVISVVVLFLLQQGQFYSRLAMFLTFAFYIALSFAARVAWKMLLLKHLAKDGDRVMLIVSTGDCVSKALDKIIANNYARYTIGGIALVDESRIGDTVDGVPVVADAESLPSLLCTEWIDEALVSVPADFESPMSLVESIAETGVAVHYGLSDSLRIPEMKQFIESIGDYTVITTSINYASMGQLFVKRVIDVGFGLVGCLATGIIAVVLAPVMFVESPGPLLYSQERVGRNGRHFKMYKFRSMYLDADERREELMGDNKFSDARMFKMDFDPRVIGNRILSDGSRKTGIGEFIRRTSIDEFPQFFNVLKGDMSVVGTRPPLVSETAFYEAHHRARLAIKPGITGLWQISGRSNITDFEEVVRLDREYINNWSIRLDLKILAKTVVVVLNQEGSV